MKRRFVRCSAVATAAMCALLFLLTGTLDRAVASQVLAGHVPSLAAHLKPLKHMDATNRLRLAISLPLRNKGDLTNLFLQICDPASPNYRHYLTAPQFADRFGPTAGDYRALAAFVMSNHLAVVGAHPNRTLLDVTGSVADIERAFNVKIQVYQHPTQNRTFYAPDSDPTVSLDVPLLHIGGLDNAILPYTKLRRKKIPDGGAIGYPRGTGSGPNGTFQGYDFRDAYVPGVTLNGAGQSVALFELDGYFASDVAEYESGAGLPNVPLVNVLLDGFNGVPESDDGDTECTLDIDMAIAMAPGLSSVFVYEGFVPEDILNRIATDDISRQISSSWGWEPFDPTINQIFQEYGVQGQTFYNASGDDGAETQSQLIIPPSDDPYITEVGGTTLTTTGPLGSWVSETTWSWFATYGLPDASSGGISFTYAIPSWQQGINMSVNGGSTTFRNYPDVALTADNVYIISEGGVPQPGIGGTSCAAPLWAGFTALVNQQAAANGEQPMGFIAPTIYALAKSSAYSSTFHDITTGNDTNFVSPNLFFAFPGYDLCTGWGTPGGSNLINALAPRALTPVLSVLTNFITGGNGNGIIDYDECNDLTIVLTNSGGSPASNIQATLFSSTPGAIVGQGAATYTIVLTNGTAVNSPAFTLSTEPTFVCGTPVNLTLVLKYGSVVQTNFITLPSGILGPPQTFASTTAFPIPNTNFIFINSPITVSGLQTAGHITVGVYLTSIYDEGITMQLVSPNGTTILLSQFNGGFAPDYGSGCSTNSETIFDDSAPVSILGGSAPFPGSYQPQQPLSNLDLSSGTNLNGVWTLQVSDELSIDSATLQCWSLNVTPEICSDGGGQCPGADVSLTMTAVPNPVFENSNLVFNLTVSNAGPRTADAVTIIQGLPPGFGFVTTSNYPVQVSQSGTNLDMVLGSLPVYGTATVSVVTIPSIPGLGASTTTVGSQESDPNPNNNTATVDVVVSQPTADLAVTMTGSPSNVLQDGLLTYTINVTNNGPFTADSVELNTSLPANANFISATTSQGTVSFNGTFAALGDIPTGTNVVVTIVISPTLTGEITATTVVSLSPTEVDPISLNNTATVNTTVGPAADLSVTAVATPSSVVTGSNVTYVSTVSNAGPSTATNIAYSQSIPANSTFVSSSLSVVVTNSEINATNLSLASGASLRITNVIKSPAHTQLMISTISVFGQPGDPNTNNNAFTIQTLAEPPIITIAPTGATVLSGSSNGAIGPSGTYSVELYLQNVGTVPTTNLVATLLNTNGVTLSSGAATYGVLQPGATPTGGVYSFTANSTNGGVIVATLQLQDGTNNLGTTNFNFAMPVVQTFWNTNFISIPEQADIPQPDSGPANPYPSIITVSNVAGDVATVTVTVSNLYHTYPNDIGMLLVGPTGASCVLMSAVAEYSTMSGAATITFAANAPNILPFEGTIASGVYLPADYYATEYNTTETFSNSPVPTGPYNTNMAVFGSISANGTWSLYIEDDANADSGAISNGWGLAITTITPVNQVADLAASIVANSNQVVLGGVITNFWTVTNNGPDAAPAYVTNTLSSGLTLSTNLLPPGATNIQGGPTYIYSLGTIAAGSGVVVTNIVTTVAGGPQTNTITVGSAVLDGNPGNNSASDVVTVNPPPADLSVAAISAVPNPVVVNSNVVYTLYVTNNGPSNAFNVVGTFTFTNSSSLRLVSASSSQGNCVTNTGFVTCNLGTVSNGEFAAVMVAATAESVGLISNGWSVTTTSDDTNLSNNSVTGTVTVTLPVAVITNGPATLVSQASPPFNGAINANQTNTVSFTLMNVGSGPTTNLVATLVPNSGLTVITSSNAYGAIAPGGSASQSFTLVGAGSAGSTITAELTLRDGSNTNFAPVFYTFVIPVTQSFTNSGAIVIPDIGPGSPYPSVIDVSSLTNGATNLLVTKVTATLNGFAHSFPHDVEAVLVDPAGQEVVLMEHTGGPYNVSNVVLTFDDAATQHLPSNNILTNGTYLTTAYAPFDILPGLQPVPSDSTNLAFFNGTPPIGLWSLYVYDDTEGNDGIIANGWSLNLTAVSTVNPAARLVVTTIEAPNPVIGGNYVSYQITVSNAGPGVATGVYLTNTISAGASWAASPVTLSQGTYTISGSAATCNLGTINAGAIATITVKIIAGVSGTLTDTAVAATSSADLYLPDATSALSLPVQDDAPALSAALITGGQLKLTLSGFAGETYLIQTSTNLKSWTTVTTNTGSFIYTDTHTNGPQRFYRAIQVPQ